MESAQPEAGGQPRALFPSFRRHGELIYLSGQAPVDPATFELVAVGFDQQTNYVLDAITRTLDDANSSLGSVLRVECMLANADDFAAWNAAFATRFDEPRPARTTVVTGFTVPGMLIELQVTACTASSAL